MTTIRSLANLYLRRRFACLFFSLLLTMVAAPVLASMGFSNRFMELFLVVNIFAAVVVTLFGFGTYVGLGLLALVLILRSGHALLDYEPLLSTSHGGGVAIFLVSICILLRFILSDGTVNSERIFCRSRRIPAGRCHVRAALLRLRSPVAGIAFHSRLAARGEQTKPAGAYDLFQLCNDGHRGVR